MVVKCPYGEKKGFAVFCRLLGQKVSPLKYPCTSDHYEKCPVYQERAEKREEAPKEVPREPPPPPKKEAKEEAPKPPPQRPATFKRPEEASNCFECIFYSELTRMCLKLKIRVEDPYNPPCKK
ncbi:MAG: hypothetical protein GXO07_06260 [Crenarchaeota archaeon]|nr:hypothetical protein [Thermoproteota archaeon]